MPQPSEKAVQMLFSSKTFKAAVKDGNFELVKNQVNSLIKAYHTALCIQAVSVFGKCKLSTAQIVKSYLREMDAPKVDYYPH